MTANIHDVESEDDFKAQLEKDLQRVSVINFWAEYAKQECAKMTEHIADLAKQEEYKSVLFLQVILHEIHAKALLKAHLRRSTQ